MHVVKNAVEDLDNLEDSFAGSLVTLGANHPVRADFSPDKCTSFIHAVLSVWKSVLMDKMTPECSVAWEILFGYMLMKMKIGHVDRYAW